MPQNWKTPHGSMNFGSLKFAKVQPSNIAQPRIQCDCTIEPQLQQLHAKQCHCNVETLYGTNKNMWRMCHHWKHNAVDGRNPTPVDRQFIPLFTGFYLFQVVQDVFHQQFLFGSSAIISLFPLDCTKKTEIPGHFLALAFFPSRQKSLASRRWESERNPSMDLVSTTFLHIY